MVGNVSRQLQSEYILKSLVNFSSVLLQNDPSPEDSFYDIWAIFNLVPRIPPEYLGIMDQSAEVSMEILPLNSGININKLRDVSTSNTRVHDGLQKLMENLGFDSNLSEEDQFGPKAGLIVTSHELVANLVDWQDSGTDALNKHPYLGFEDQVKDQFNTEKSFDSIEETASVPGMTQNRLNAIAPYIYTFNKGSGEFNVNINTAPKQVILASNDGVSEQYAEDLISQRNSLGASLTKAEIDDLNSQGNELLKATLESDLFLVQAEVKYGLQRPFLVRAIIKQGSTNSPSKILEANYF